VRRALSLIAGSLGMLAFGAAQASAYCDEPSYGDPAHLVTYPSAEVDLDA
jgi:hypothetical protein